MGINRSCSMKCSLIAIDISTASPLRKEFTGSIFRGWLGTTLKCDSSRECNDSCEDRQSCPYSIIFHEKNEVKPFSLLSFPEGTRVRNLLKIYGDRKRFVPRILSMIHANAHERCRHFGTMPYTIEGIESRMIEIPSMELGQKTEVVFISPTHLLENGALQLIPSFSGLCRGCVRAYNRVTKFYDHESYPFRHETDLFDSPAEILDYNVKRVTIVHENMFDRRIRLEGIMGSVLYDTANVPPEAGTILKMGEMLQVGKHSTYGFGGMVVKH